MFVNQRNMEQKTWTKIATKLSQFDLVWKNIVLIFVLHLAAFYGFYLKFFSMHFYTRLFAIMYAHICGFGVTAGRHRYFCHRSFKGSRILDVLFMIMASSTYEQSIYCWVRDHRLHHKHSETDADPYNSNRGFFFSHIGWFFIRKHQDVKEKGKTIDMSDLETNPIVTFEHKYCIQLALVFSLILPTVIPWYFWNESLKISFFYCTAYRIVLILHLTWSVNSFAHMYGTRNYDKNIAPVDNKIVATVTFGEGFHNYHHSFPWDYKAAELGDDFGNVTTYFIDGLAWIGLVTERKTATKELIENRKVRTGNPFWFANKHNIKSSLFYVLYITCFC